MVVLSSAISVNQECTGVVINLEESGDNHFILEDELLAGIEQKLDKNLKGGKLIHNDLNRVENHVKNNKFVKRAQVLSDHKGKIVINVIQERPIARIVTNSGSYYLTESGKIMPISINYSARVMVVLGDKIDEILLSDSTGVNLEKSEFIDFINYVHQDKFLKAQIASLEMLENGKVLIYPQVTKQVIEFGTCENYVDKLWRLKVFYHQILPRKGWNSYDRVSLEFNNQIICE